MIIILKEAIFVNKSELVASVAEAAELTKKDAEKAVNAVFASVQKALVEDDKVQIIGFGTFEVRTRAARKGRNPQTGETIDIPESKNPVFKAGKALKDAVNQ
nr:HU family DNA-binding protein [Megamonas hypermegale]